MWRLVLIGIGIIAVVVFGFSLLDISGADEVGANTILQPPPDNIEGFTRATDPDYDWQFPRDFGAHPNFQTEWWYYTGNVATDDGRRFGYQFTIFRRAILPTDNRLEDNSTASEWRTRQIYMAHFTISDIAGETFYHDQRFSRGGAGLAGATVDPRYRVWLEDWQILAQNDEASLVKINAVSDEFAVDMTLQQVKPPALQGQGGLSPKSAETGNASYYYTLSRLMTTGTITIGENTYAVEGLTWKDHEFSTSALGTEAQGWDWFGLIFDDGREMMVGQIRMIEGGVEPAFGGLLIDEDGSTRYLTASDFTITPLDTWTSPHTGAVYPSGWTIDVQNGYDGQPFTITVMPLMLDQELHGANVEYWEGAVRITGDATGYGYAELTGYVDTMQGRF